jgi:signal transduction histidine kinase
MVRYWIGKLVARFYAGEHAAALVAAAKAQQMPELKLPGTEYAEYHFYAALSHAASFASSSVDERSRHFSAIVAHHRQLIFWAEDCPGSFANWVALVGAEIARIDGRVLDAERLYEEAIQSARQNGFTQHEGLAQELAARFYAARGLETISNAYLQNARACYVRWGADGKVRQLDLEYPDLVPQQLVRPGSGRTIGTPVEQLDLRTELKHTGATRCLLILPRGEEMWIEAEATVAADTLEVRRPKARVAPSALPESVLHYAIRTRDSVLLDDAMAQEPFSEDTYVRRNKSRSLLCLPLIKQTQLIGVLYLENGLTSHAFGPARIALLRLLASQAVTSLENARLYSELRDASAFLAQAQRLSSTGSFSWRVSTGEITWSAQLYRIFEFDQGVPVTLELIGSRVHPEDLAQFADMIARAQANADHFEYEHRLLMPDHSIKYLHLVAHASRDQDGQLEYIGASQDVTRRRLSEEALRKARSELAHVARVTSIGALTASMAHEVTQPLAGIVSNADSCLLWLAKEEPNLDKARRAAERIVRDGHRAAQVIQSIRAQARKSATQTIILDMRHLIGDTLELVQSELQRHAVSLQTRFPANPRFIMGDPTQLQQVIVNLIMNAIEAIDASARTPRVIRVITQSDQKGDVLTSVEDSGSGIDEEVLGRIFDPMFTTKPHGMGLGLSICRSIVEGHGGRLWASPNPTGGSIFRFSIPEAKHAEVPPDTIA